MDAKQALDLFAELPGHDISKLWQAGLAMAGTELRPGLWLGRNGGMVAPLKWLIRELVKRDYFAKLVADGFGVNVRVNQDGSHLPLPSPDGIGGCKVDLPFALTDAGLDYGFHLCGIDAGALQMRDRLRRVSFASVARVAPPEQLARVGVAPGEGGEGELVIGYILPLGIELLRGTPFGMVWSRPAIDDELAAADRWIGRRRWFDSSVVGIR